MEKDYEGWTQQQFVAKIRELEAHIESLKELNSRLATSNLFKTVVEPIPYRKPPKKPPNAFDASRYTSRLIALKFAYLGQNYNGFEHHNNNATPLPTIEEELWKTLVKTKLINPKSSGTGNDQINWDDCEYSKCGRTDRGVSAFGQVIGVRVRSNRPLPKTTFDVSGRSETVVTDLVQDQEEHLLGMTDSKEPIRAFDDVTDELPYIQLLNRILPPDIRVYAWCPTPPPDFSARFSCKERRYKYFFTNPCYSPPPGATSLYVTTPDRAIMREGWLDIDKMRQACKHLIGLHDFRNFCKVDASKQITNYHRRIFHADIEEISPLSLPSFLTHEALQSGGSKQQPKVFAFVIHGSAFLWHQVRSIAAILFLIGQGFESPSLIPALLDISANPTRPKYEMASDAPLVLWDCIFPHASAVQSTDARQQGYEDSLDWVYVGDEGSSKPKSLTGRGDRGPSTLGRGKWGRGGVIDDVWEVWRQNKIDETLSALLLDTVAAQGMSTLNAELEGQRKNVGSGKPIKGGPRLFDGGDVGKGKGHYTPILQRERQDPVELVNERYAQRKGLEKKKKKKLESEHNEFDD